MTTINTYEVGTLVRVNNINPATGLGFIDINGNPIDPASVHLQFSLLDANGRAIKVTEWVYGGAGSIVRDALSLYHGDLDTTGLPGLWEYRWYAPPGVGQSAKGRQFLVTDRAVAH